MGTLTENYKTIKDSVGSISNSLIAKKVGSVNSLDQVADEIRKIEKGSGSYTVIVDFGNNYGVNQNHLIEFKITENNRNGKVLLNISETVPSPTQKGQYEYTFSTDVDTIYVSHTCCYFSMAAPLLDSKTATLNNLKQHKTIKIVGNSSGDGDVLYAD